MRAIVLLPAPDGPSMATTWVGAWPFDGFGAARSEGSVKSLKLPLFARRAPPARCPSGSGPGKTSGGYGIATATRNWLEQTDCKLASIRTEPPGSARKWGGQCSDLMPLVAMRKRPETFAHRLLRSNRSVWDKPAPHADHEHAGGISTAATSVAVASSCAPKRTGCHSPGVTIRPTPSASKAGSTW